MVVEQIADVIPRKRVYRDRGEYVCELILCDGPLICVQAYVRD
jgi:hypothetical protein